MTNAIYAKKINKKAHFYIYRFLIEACGNESIELYTDCFLLATEVSIFMQIGNAKC